MLKERLKTTFFALFPIVLIVTCVHFFSYSFTTETYVKFLLGIVLLFVGELLFLTGVDTSIMPMGNYVGDASDKLRRFFILLIFGFFFGFFATIAEPDVQVLSGQVNVSKWVFLFVAGAGVGVGVALALLKIAVGWNMKWIVLCLLGCVFILAFCVPNSLVAIAFDAGGATAGIVTAPFLIALASGVAKNKSSKTSSNSFGMLGIVTLCPVIVMLILSLFYQIQGGQANAESQYSIVIDALVDTSLAIVPIFIIFFVFEALFIKLPKRQVAKLLLGGLLTFVGLFLFLYGINIGLIEIGREFGVYLTSMPNWFSVVLCGVLGLCIAFTEPGVRILGKQVERVTKGNIKSRIVVCAVAASVALSVILCYILNVYSVPILWVLLAGYAFIILFMFIDSEIFVGIAFDAGGVASGPMCASFLLPLMLGVSSITSGASSSGFGVLALIGMMPILVVEVLGCVYKVQVENANIVKRKTVYKGAMSAVQYSNMEDLEYAHRKLKRKKQEQTYR